MSGSGDVTVRWQNKKKLNHKLENFSPTSLPFLGPTCVKDFQLTGWICFLTFCAHPNRSVDRRKIGANPARFTFRLTSVQPKKWNGCMLIAFALA